jgi:hypothetical protein
MVIENVSMLLQGAEHDPAALSDKRCFPDGRDTMSYQRDLTQVRVLRRCQLALCTVDADSVDAIVVAVLSQLEEVEVEVQQEFKLLRHLLSAGL